MAQASRPTPDNGFVLSADEYEQLAIGYAPDGMIGAPSFTSPVYADSTGRQVKIRSGRVGLVRGRLWKGDPTTDEIVSGLPANTSGNPRIDRLVLRLDRATGNVRTQYLQGTAAATPVAPTLTQSTSVTTGLWDFPLARWTVANGYTTVAAVDVTNEAWYLAPNSQLLCTPTSRPFGAGIRVGQPLYEYGPGYTYLWNSTKWLRQNALVVKTADEPFSVRTTLTDDAVLLFPVEINSTYGFEFEILWSAGATPKYAHGIKFPASCRIDYSRIAVDSSAAIFRDAQVNAGSGSATVSAPNAGGVGSTSFRGMIVVGATAGNVVFAAAQNVSSATTCQTQRGSFVKHWQVA